MSKVDFCMVIYVNYLIATVAISDDPAYTFGYNLGIYGIVSLIYWAVTAWNRGFKKVQSEKLKQGE